MSDKMRVLPFEKLLRWILDEYSKHRSIFGIPESKFFRCSTEPFYTLFGKNLEMPFGPAAGPHTQLSQNIITSYLTGCRFIELKTVQIIDDLEFGKPCIDAFDEGYNTEWSQELSLKNSLDEYAMAWTAIHLLKDFLNLSNRKGSSGFIFNMSVGYDLAGIQSEKMDRFINDMIDAGEVVESYLETARKNYTDFPEVSVPHRLSDSVTISTMHGCPPDEIENMARYLIAEKGLNTYVKLNPTLLGKERVREILKTGGFDYISVKDETFEKDLQYKDAVRLIKNLKGFAKNHNRDFGVKLSNTLANQNTGGILPGEERYMSGRALYPLAIHLAHLLASESDFKGDLSISYSAGASAVNIRDILDTGIFPVTMATDILKPGGYLRFHQIAEELKESIHGKHRNPALKIDLEGLARLAQRSLTDPYYKKQTGKLQGLKLSSRLGLFDCIVAPCVVQCPIHQDIPEYIDCISAGDYTGALKAIVKKNPLPNITGYICDHTCVTKCVRWDYDNPIAIRELKRVAARRGSYGHVLSSVKDELKSKTKRGRIAVLGGGPAGLASCFFLAREGFTVTLFESRKKTGGTVRHSIPRFRLPDSVIDEDVSMLKELGVNVITGCSREFSIEGLKEEGYDHIIVTTGSGWAKELAADGLSDLEGYYTGIEFLERVKREEKLVVGKKVLIIGGGNSAVDAARTALRFRPEYVHIVYRRDIQNMPADREEVDACFEEGIEIKELLGPEEVLSHGGRVTGLRCSKMRLGDYDESGRRRPVPVKTSTVILAADTIIAAVGEELDRDVLVKNGITLLDGRTVFVNQDTGETNIPDVYAGGDCVRGPATVVEAIADAKKITSAILKIEGIEDGSILADCYYIHGPEQRIGTECGKHGDLFHFNPVERLPLDKRDTFETVIQTLDDEKAARESKRCLLCNQICNKCVETCPNRANVSLAFNPLSLNLTVGGPAGRPLKSEKGQTEDSAYQNVRIDQARQILHLDDFCNECGNCETFCPHEGKPYSDKITLFSRMDMFESSTNQGFYLKSSRDHDEYHFQCRLNGTCCDMLIDFEKAELLFSIDGKKILLGIDGNFMPAVLKNGSIEDTINLDLTDMIGLYSMAVAVLKNHSYLL
jgi:putative selenate reductase